MEKAKKKTRNTDLMDFSLFIRSNNNYNHNTAISNVFGLFKSQHRVVIITLVRFVYWIPHTLAYLYNILYIYIYIFVGINVRLGAFIHVMQLLLLKINQSLSIELSLDLSVYLAFYLTAGASNQNKSPQIKTNQSRFNQIEIETMQCRYVFT